MFYCYCQDCVVEFEDNGNLSEGVNFASNKMISNTISLAKGVKRAEFSHAHSLHHSLDSQPTLVVREQDWP